jgi:hypothetical protein
MKVKGAGFFELHIEKIVLAVVAAVFVLVLVIQLGAEGPTVTVNNQKLPLDQAYEPAERLARDARSRMNAQEPPLPDVGEQVDLLGRFHQGRAAELAPRDRIVLGPSINLGEVGEGGEFGNTPFVQLVIPPPQEPVAFSFAATLDPWVVSETEGLAALVGPSQPYDKAAVSVQATYDTAELERILRAEPEGELSAWPISWWRGSMEILAVRLERQRQNSDGSWSSEIETVATPPGALDLPTELAETPDLAPRHIKAIVEQVQRGLAQQVRRPAYYPIIAGDPWVEPREGVRLTSLEAGANPDVARNQKDLANIDRQIAQLEQERAQLTGGRDPRQGEGRAMDRATENRVRRIDRDLERLTQRREQAVAWLTERGFAPEEQAGEQDPLGRRQGEQRPGLRPGQGEVEPLFAGERLQVWAHDLTAEPGATYRYRVRLEMTNPAFGQSQFLVEEQKSLSEAPTVFSEPSPWTEPVVVAPMTAFLRHRRRGDPAGRHGHPDGQRQRRGLHLPLRVLPQGAEDAGAGRPRGRLGRPARGASDLRCHQAAAGGRAAHARAGRRSAGGAPRPSPR